MIRKPNNEELDYLYKLVEEVFSVKYNDNVYTNWLIYVENNKIIGFLNYDSIYENAEIEYIYVDKLYRNKSIATQLFNKMLEEIGNVDITLEVRSDNEAAINFYKKNGFESVAKRDNYYGNIDAILMHRRRL